MKAPQTLKEMLEAAIVRHNGASIRRLSFLARDHGFQVTDTTLNHMRAGTYKSTPKAETLRAIAWLAGVDEAVAFTAAGQPAPGPPLADELPPGSDNLSPRSRQVVIDMVRVLVDQEAVTSDVELDAKQVGRLVDEYLDGASGDAGAEQKITMKDLALRSVPALARQVAAAWQQEAYQRRLRVNDADPIELSRITQDLVHAVVGGGARPGQGRLDLPPQAGEAPQARLRRARPVRARPR